MGERCPRVSFGDGLHRLSARQIVVLERARHALDVRRVRAAGRATSRHVATALPVSPMIRRARRSSDPSWRGADFGRGASLSIYAGMA